MIDYATVLSFLPYSQCMTIDILYRSYKVYSDKGYG